MLIDKGEFRAWGPFFRNRPVQVGKKAFGHTDSIIVEKEKEKSPEHPDLIYQMEQATGIGPACRPWQGRVLPLNYACKYKMADPTGFEPVIFSVTGRRDRPLH